jgi:DNA polymerase-3 subunit alpha
MNRSTFIHLHLHSQFSILESTIKFEPLFARLKELHMPAVALTDKGNLFGAIPFYRGCKSNGLKPILGLEVLVATGSRFDSIEGPRKADKAHPLVLLAEDLEGFKNLMGLSSAGYLQSPGDPPRVDKSLLARHAKGLIALSAGERGELDRLLLKGETPLAVKAAGEYAEIYGKDRFFLELTNHGKSDDHLILQYLLELSVKTGLPVVAANGVGYLQRRDAAPHEVLLSLGKGQVFSDPNHSNWGSEQYYLKSQEEMASLFGEIPGALRNTIEIAMRCNVELEFEKTRMPSFPLLPEGTTADAYLEKVCREGLPSRFGDKANEPEVQERLKEELSVITKTGFPGYFLIVWDIISRAKKKGIPVGPGRGSAAGSLAAYLAGITDVDPLKYDLLFERFINPERVSAPDIDVDVSDTRRGEVLDYITRTYGKERVASIVTFGTMAAKAVVRDVGRVLEIPLTEVDRIAKLIPYEPKVTLSDVETRVPELKAIATEEGPHRRWWDVSKALEGLVRHISTHAAGILISDEPLLSTIPLCKGAHGEILTQYEMNALKDVGLLKLDILGLRTLSVIDDTVRLVSERKGVSLQPEKFPLDDNSTFRLFRDARTLGVFQLESRGMRDYLRKLGPTNIEDIIAINALYRPGPLGSDMVDDFIHRKKGQVKVEYLHPLLEPILKTTYGVLLYQEQVMRVAKDLAGFSLGQADLLRRAMGSKNPEKMEQMRGKFITGAGERKIPSETAESIYNQMAKFGGYGFNKSHSAAYALVAYQTAYLKAHFGSEFMAALLTSETGNQDKVSQYVYECRRMGFQVLPPDVNESGAEFTVSSEGAIRFSLTAVKNVGTPAMEAILQARKAHGPFKSLEDFCARVDLKSFTPKMVESLIQAGAFPFSGTTRAGLTKQLDLTFRRGQGIQSDFLSGQTSLFGSLSGEPATPGIEEVPEWSPVQILNGEKEILGFYLSGHPLSEHEKELDHYVIPLTDLEDCPDGSEVRVGGLIRSFAKTISRKSKEEFGRFVVEDLHTHVEVIAWPETFHKYQSLLGKDRLVALRGRLDKSGNRLQIVANEVIDVNEMAVKWAKRVNLDLNVVGLDDALLPRVQDVCKRHPGKATVRFRLQTSHHGLIVVESGPEYCVKPTKSFLREMTLLLGEDRVEIEMDSSLKLSNASNGEEY